MGPPTDLAADRAASIRLGALIVVWALAIMAGIWAIDVHADRPGPPARPPPVWPADSSVVRKPGVATLVLLLHPGCPCGSATLAELERIMARGQGRVASYVLFWSPRGAAGLWDVRSLRRRASSIAGVRVRSDRDGREAARFDVRTSGEVVLYDATGRLRFAGGITAGRGEEGDNPGRRAVVGILNGGPGVIEAPVFGCTFSDPKAPGDA